MVDRKQLLDDLKPLLKALEVDLRARCDEVAEIGAGLQCEYEQARAAGRCGVTFEEWRADLITQVAAAWILSCVFVRFLEDNALIAPPRISGPLHGAGEGAGLMRARDEREQYFKSHPKETDRDYLLAVFDELAKLPGTKDVFGPHNLVNAYRNWLSGDAAQKLIEFFQKIDADGTGELVHDFTDPAWDTRFLGDLYQDLSEAARKKYALLQTPIFVEEFILERTLEPALSEFGLAGFKMIDPACGSGHFVLGSFARILARWRRHEPGTSVRELVNRALAAVHGVDLNPYAVAIARFRLLLVAMRECQVTRLKDAPAFRFNLVCGDSLLHGAAGQQTLGFHELGHVYESEDLPELHRILATGGYHAVVANPPYITVKDKALNQAYRERYPEVCHMKYSLSVPFLQRLFLLACDGGFSGQITANSFMKREFGKKLVEGYLPKVDLTYVIDTGGAYIPGHGTPTVILFGRNRRPVAPTVRAVMGIKGEPSTPEDPAHGLVWTAITRQIDQVGSQSAFVSVSDTARAQFGKHPWSIGGGGAAELKERLDNAGATTLGDEVDAIGFGGILGEDEAFYRPLGHIQLRSIPVAYRRPFIQGETVRDWGLCWELETLFPYDDRIELVYDVRIARLLWPLRTLLWARNDFSKEKYRDCGRTYWEFHQIPKDRNLRLLRIVFAEVATHNHFVVEHGARMFDKTAPLIQFGADAEESRHFDVAELLNSSTACFWLKQVCQNKGSTVDNQGARQRTAPFEDFFQFNGTKLLQFPIPAERPPACFQQLHVLAAELATSTPAAACRAAVPTSLRLRDCHRQCGQTVARMIALQEELDWQCYGLYGLVPPKQLTALRCESPPPLRLGQRAFEIALARRTAAGQEDTTWFARHGSTPITELPAEWSEDYRRVVQQRIELIETDRNIALIERPEHKRRWNTEPWDEQERRALRGWLLVRLERFFDLDGRMNDDNHISAHAALRQPRLTSVVQVADIARADRDFMQVAELYVGRMDFDVANLVGELIAAESVPALPVLRYEASGSDKRAAWERTWDLQRAEDAIDALFDALKTHQTRRPDEEARLKQTPWLREFVAKSEWARVEPGLKEAAGYVAEAVKQKLNLEAETVAKPLLDAARRAKQAVIGDIPVPPKYVSADFLSSDFWRLRGKLDVPKERWVSFPHCEGEDGTLVIAWAGYDHLQLARAIAERYEHAKEQEGRKLVPLLAAIGQLIPWLKQWHNDLDPVFNQRMGDYFESYLAEEAKALGKSVAEVMAWTPPERTAARRQRAKAK